MNDRKRRAVPALPGPPTPHLGGARPPDPVDRECLGAYPSLEAFARDAVTALLRPEGRWLLDCLDLPRVLQVLAGDDRLLLHDGRVYLDRRP